MKPQIELFHHPQSIIGATWAARVVIRKLPGGPFHLMECYGIDREAVLGSLMVGIKELAESLAQIKAEDAVQVDMDGKPV